MRGGAVSESAPIYYEEMSKVAGKENDKQSITLIATDDAYNFGDYITLRSRTGHKPQVLTDRGAIISERMAGMMDAKVGTRLPSPIRAVPSARCAWTASPKCISGISCS